MKQDKHLFEYAVVRIVPKPEREEFVNVGVVLYCKDKRFLQAKCDVNETKVKAICDDFCIEEVQEYLDAFKAIAAGDKDCKSPIARLDLPSRFRWLAATRSSVVQTSKVHPGLCTDPQSELDKLFQQMVL